MKKILSLILILILAILFLSFDVLAEKKVKKDAKKSEIIGMVTFVKGKAEIKKAGTKKRVPLKIKTKVTAKDEIKTPAKSEVIIKLRNKKLVKIKPKTKVVITKLLKKSKKTKVKGSLKSVFSKTKKGKEDKNKFGVTAVGGVRGEDVSKKKEKVKSDELESE